ncbi:MAG: [protein-PII] uridylyltransferase [Rhodospirillaceae bacterium]|nr:[protein-PII] uridylyltransferase [Rhodospirillaceae bacterium]|tara:strand:+ start:35277 stop:38048 length:2772 start_codon:yes stop_codon:yes gene_type:complete
MATIIKRRDIIDIKSMQTALDEQLEEEASAGAVRLVLLNLVRDALENGTQEIRRRFENDSRLGEATIRANAFLIDQILRFAFEATTTRIYPTAEATESERICIAAVGGYGRGEMAPYSDIDLLFLLPYRLTPRVEQIIESMLYLLWDLGLKVGHATRTIDDCIRLSLDDITIRTSILEARFVDGNKGLFNQLRRQFRDKVVADTALAFVEAKLEERDVRHRRMGDSRYVLEPNIKDGKGGLRDLQTLFWIAKYLYQVDAVEDLVAEGVLTAGEAKSFARAETFLWTVRCHLHYLTGRAEDRLTFDLQTEIGDRLGYKDHAGTRGIERFMKHYYLTAKEVGDLTRIFCAALESEERRSLPLSFVSWDWLRRDIDGFPIKSGRLSVSSSKDFEENPTRILQLFHVAQQREIDVHPNALRLVTRNIRKIDTIRDEPEANRLFLEMLISPKGAEVTLRRLNESSVFGRFVPDFGRVVAQMQHDMYHVYTVDEHTIFAIGILHGIEQGKYQDDMPVASDVIHKISSRRALFVSLFLHDIAKGRGGDHSVLGAEVADTLCPRLGLSAEETETVAWLVRHHLLMSRIAFHRDLTDPKSIRDFAISVQSLERLRLLLLLTVADIRAVGPNVWNNWKASLLRELYFATEAQLSGGHDATGREARIEGAKAAVRDGLQGWDEEQREQFIGLGYPSYWLSIDTESHLRHAKIIRTAQKSEKELALDIRVDSENDVTEFTIYTADHPGLFSRIAGAMAVSGANIVDAKIFTTTSGMALDIFSIQDSKGKAFDDKISLDRLKTRIERTLTGEINISEQLDKTLIHPTRAEVFTVPTRVLINNSASQTHSLVEINARDQAGLLHRVTRTLTQLGLQISSALITTYGERAVDVFYVKDTFGMQITHEDKLEQIRTTLLEEIAEEPEATASSEKIAAVS